MQRETDAYQERSSGRAGHGERESERETQRRTQTDTEMHACNIAIWFKICGHTPPAHHANASVCRAALAMVWESKK